VDLERLKINRDTPRRANGRSGAPRRTAWIALALVVLAAAWLLRTPLTSLVDRLRLPGVRVAAATRTTGLEATAVSGTSANGYVVAATRAALSADTPGRIVEMNVREGSVVKEGEVVARIFSEEYEAALRRTEAQIGSAEAALASARAEEQSAKAQLPALAADVSAARARVAEAEAALRLTTLELQRVQSLRSDDLSSQQALDRARADRDRAAAVADAQRAALTRAEATVLQGRARVEVASAGVQQSRAQVDVARAARDEARALRDKTAVRAPFDGVVVLKDAEVGEVVSPNAQGGSSRGSVVTMIDFASLEVQVEVPETRLAAVEQGAPAHIYLDAYPATLYTGTVERIWPTANRQKATVEVRVGFDAPDARLRPELGARVVFSPEVPATVGADAAAPAERVLVPEGTIVRSAGAAGVLVLERDVVRWQGIALGEARGGRVAVLSGLEGGERLVLDPPAGLADGDRVRVIP
jgi:RND family efflux transporter MFP subunit